MYYPVEVRGNMRKSHALNPIIYVKFYIIIDPKGISRKSYCKRVGTIKKLNHYGQARRNQARNY